MLIGVNIKDVVMAKKRNLFVLSLFVIGLLFIQLGLFCYSLYDPTIRFYPECFPLRFWSYYLLPFGIGALVIGTFSLLSTDEKEKNNPCVE